MGTAAQLENTAPRRRTAAPSARWSFRARRGERGGALVEGALVTPLVLLVVFGVFEFSLTFRQYLTVVNAARNTARTAVVNGNSVSADYKALQEFARSTKAITPSEIEFVVVFKAPSVSASPENTASLSSCLTGSVAGKCNRYTTTDLARAQSAFTGVSGAPDAAWAPASRIVSASGPPDLLGVYVKTRHQATSGIFGSSHAFTDTVVYRIEPQTR